MEFWILGPLEVHQDGRSIQLPSPREQRPLAMLLLSTGHVVPLAHLVDAVWTGSPPPRAKRQVQNRLSALRDRLGEASELIVADGPGYRTLVGDDQLDALRFQKPHSHISLSS